jgi:hypothetical protein
VPNDILGLQARGREIGVFQVGENRKAALVIGLAVLGRGHAAGGAGKKLRPELLLQLHDVFAHGRAGQAQIPGSCGEAIVLHHLGEGADAGQLVHGW